jgi:sugar lactone lactonase YvrE
MHLPIRAVDEQGLLGTLPATSKHLFHIMTKTIFLRFLLAATALAALPFATSTVRGGSGDILETNEMSVLRFRPLGGTPTTFAVGFGSPKGIVFDGLGRAFVADASRGNIVVFTLPDGSGTTYASGLSSPVGLAFDVAGNLYAAESGSGAIVKFDRDRIKTTFATGTGNPAGLAFDNSGNLFVADFEGGKIYKITPDGTKSTFASGLDFPAGLAVNTSNELFVSESETGKIFKFAPDGTKTVFATDLSRPYGLAIEEGDNLIVADNGNGGTFRYSPEGVRATIFSSEFNTPQFLAVEPTAHQVLNVSTRGLVQSGENVLIAGFTIGGLGPVGTSVLVRALGPSLTEVGVVNALPNPVLELHDASGALIGSNNNWKDTQEEAITNTHLAPTNDLEAAILMPLHGGAFTAVVISGTGAPGIAVVDVYNLQ